MDQALLQEISRSERYSAPLAVLLLDIEHFKSVNDTFGHLAGDSVLIEFGHLLKKNSRDSDLAGRWGGEEFLVLTLPSSIAALSLGFFGTQA